METISNLKSFMQRRVNAIYTVVLGMFATPAFADLPTTADPTRGSTDGNFILLLQDYAFDILIFAGLLVSTVTFFVVVKNVMGSYSEVGTGKGTWGAVGVHSGAGVLLLVLVVFLLTEAAAIL